MEEKNKTLQANLNKQFKIISKGNEALEKKIAELGEQNATPCSNLNRVNQKLGKTEQLHGQVMESAASSMPE